MKPKTKKYIKFDGRPHFKVMYFENNQDGIEILNRFWHKNSLIGFHPKISYSNKNI